MKLIQILKGENPPDEMQLDFVGAFEENGGGPPRWGRLAARALWIELG